MKKISFVTSTLPMEHGGRTKSLLQRARILTQNDEVAIKIYTTNYNENYHIVYKNFRKTGKVNDHIEMENIYDYYKENKSNPKNNYKIFLERHLKRYDLSGSEKTNVFEKIIRKFQIKPEKNQDVVDTYKLKKAVDSHVTYYYTDGRVTYHISKDKLKDRVKNIDFYLPYYKKSVMRAYTDHNENVHRVIYFEPGTDKVQSEIFFNTDLHPYVVKEYSYPKDKKKLDRVILMRTNGDTQVFKTEKDFFRFWFEDLFVDGDMVINDARVLDKPLLETNKEMKKIFQLHNSHLENPEDLESNTKGSFRFLFNYDLKETDIIVSLTEGQRQDIIRRFPNIEKNIVVIPHSTTLTDIRKALNPKQICIVARLAPQKKLQDAIEAFRLFNEQEKEYTLVIYGDGEEKENLQKLIQEKGLVEKVKLMGMTHNPNEVFQESAFAVMSSLFEGFPLSALESITNGCPVVSYDVMWGPSEMLNETSGRVTKENTPEALCQEMLAEIANPKDRNQVRQRAQKFSVDAFYQAWCQLLE